ncbi:hypothetical protein JCM30471_23220 [Desulfuromonas carbonis]|uniref:hypothetical protein n=1 Tax=Desulfuromonas sp. DDH964 TaxID=1823759 RepID=UPI00078B7D7B|nr:hypothetical protein [Desulfuromonas sp. DDH964]AMV73902.1 hypothetical protein DBW_3604 [Desulfuromonas sp. DDH964]
MHLLLRKRSILLAVLLVFAVAPSLFAADVSQVTRDLAPRAGVVVMPLGSEFLIDLDASKGIRVGDLVSVMQPGEKIIHPVTKEVIGSLDTVKAVLRVTRVKSGYSYATALPGGGALVKGDPIRSYTGIPATFWDYTGTGESLYTQLKADLPDLEWQPYGLAQQQKPETPGPVPDLKGVVFILNAQGLGLRDSQYQPINFYPNAELSGRSMAAPRPVPASPAPPAVTANPAIIQAPPPAPDAGVIQARKTGEDGIWYGPDMPGLMIGVAAGNFDGSGSIQVATAFTDKVLLGQFSNGQYQGAGFLDVGKYRLLTIDAVDLDKDGRDELYLTAAERDPGSDAETISSLYAEFVDGALRVRQTGISYILGGIDVPGEGRILVGQRPGKADRTYSGALYRFVKKDGRVERGAEFPAPTDKASAQGFAITNAATGQPVYVLLDINEKLQVYAADGSQLWENSDVVGGTESYYKQRSANPRDMDLVYEYLKARVAATPDGLVMVPFNEGSTRIFKYREFTSSFLTAYRWNGRSLQEAWHTAPQGGSLTGFFYADVDNDGKNEVITSVIFNHGTALNPGTARSTLVIYELP